MVAAYNVNVLPDLNAKAGGWADEDKYTLLALIELLEEFGFDLIVNTAGKRAEWLSVEFIEPGETPDMLWASAFIDMQVGSFKLRISCNGDAIDVDSG